MDITLTLTQDEVNYVLETLGGQPFKQVNQLLQKIYSQGEAQVKAVTEATEASTKKAAK